MTLHYFISKVWRKFERKKIEISGRVRVWLWRPFFRRIGENCKFGKDSFILCPENIRIGNNFQAGNRFKICTHNDWWVNQKFQPCITIGNNVSIGQDCYISAINEITIEDNVLMASRLIIIDHDHGTLEDLKTLTPIARKLYSKGPIKIGKNVWIGEMVCILPGVTIGENTVIGAGSVVTKSMPANSIVAGNPAKVIKTL